MKKYLVNLEYDGSDFCGYATQPHENTVQDNIEMVLKKIYTEPIKTFGTSRTDARVHAKDQYFTFEAEKEIELGGVLKALNNLTKPSINIKNIKIVEDNFNPRYDVVSKEYHYKIMQAYNPFERKYAHYHYGKLDLDKMNEAATIICGTHDFTSFCNVKSAVNDKVRTVLSLKVVREEEFIVIKIIGEGFLYNMVRIIAGVLIDVGMDRIKPCNVREMIELKDRKRASKTMPPEGLFLIKINY